MRFLTFLLSVFLLASCNSDQTSPASDSTATTLATGKWMMSMDHEEITIPVRLEYTGDSLIFYNAQERIAVGDFEIKHDSLYLQLPVFGSTLSAKIHSADSLSGIWHRVHAGPDYKLSFTASPQPDAFKIYTDFPDDGPHRYAVTFKSKSEKPYPAIGEIYRDQQNLTGTFITEMGDSRFLQGKSQGSDFWLSCFDGAHLYYFTGKLEADSIRGDFYAGKSWTETFKGVQNPEAELSHPDSLTKMTTENFHFEAYDLEGKKQEFTSENFEGNVTIVQIMGTWCPNCLDETRYFKSLYDTYHDEGLDILAVGFERGETLQDKIQELQNYRERLNIDYPIYLGGKNSKDSASVVFPMLSEITSFPTSIFLDKSGEVRKIHTGFYGPGTGQWYARYTTETENFIQTLLAE